MRLKLDKDGYIDLGNPPRRNRKYVYQIIKSNYNDRTGDVYNTYCIQSPVTRKIDYFIEVCSKDKFEFIIHPRMFGHKNTLKSCRHIIKKILLFSIVFFLNSLSLPLNGSTTTALTAFETRAPL